MIFPVKDKSIESLGYVFLLLGRLPLGLPEDLLQLGNYGGDGLALLDEPYPAALPG